MTKKLTKSLTLEIYFAHNSMKNDAQLARWSVFPLKQRPLQQGERECFQVLSINLELMLRYIQSMCL